MIKTLTLLAVASCTLHSALGFCASPSLGLRTAQGQKLVSCRGASQIRMAADSKPRFEQAVVAFAAIAALAGNPFPSFAVSGGVADFVDVQGQDFSGKDLKKKDFSGANGKNAIFKGAKLQGARFFKSDLTDADFTGADLTTASLEDAKLSGVVLKDAVLRSAYTGAGLDKVKDITNGDFTDALIRPDVQAKLCDRADATGTNPKTGADTRESLQCP